MFQNANRAGAVSDAVNGCAGCALAIYPAPSDNAVLPIQVVTKHCRFQNNICELAAVDVQTYVVYNATNTVCFWSANVLACLLISCGQVFHNNSQVKTSIFPNTLGGAFSLRNATPTINSARRSLRLLSFRFLT